MNAAVRAVICAAIMRGCDAYAVHEGYQRLVDGGHLIRKMGWDDVQGYLTAVGTIIGTARYKAFRERPGRLQAAKNMVMEGTHALVIFGGDVADPFRTEWPSLMEEFVTSGELTEEMEPFARLNIAGLAGSIDNGAVTCLHRICESMDSISSTASSHSRANGCGWLALMAGIATRADFIIIPGRPPSGENWQDKHIHRDLGKRKTVVIVCEGAIASNRNPITAKDFLDHLTNRLRHQQFDSRTAILGHV
ncbi:MAG: phosphofructokinase domain-containing protein [Benniella sp.]|nr:MAG: phosphofructokinase domain-containing protein [Benniella sp.]